MLLAVVWAELRRTLQLARSYWLEYIANFVLFTFGFLLLLVAFHVASDSYGPDGYMSSLIGYVTWIICATIIEAIAEVVSNESRTGTLEQLFSAGLRPVAVLASRTVGFLLDYGIRGLLLGTVAAAILGILRPIPPFAAVVFVLTAIGACGLGFALAGLALTYRPIGGLVNPLWQMLVFFTGALAPLTLPGLVLVSKALPLTWGIATLRAIILEDATTAVLWQRGELIGLILNTAFYIVLGAALFAWGQRKARVLGTLGHY
jgi:ABC-type polysaccharide/polyol phosphate export permease